MRRGLRWAGRTAAVAVPIALGVPLAADGAMAIYAGYSSMWWPSTRATVTRFRAVPVLPDKEDEEGENQASSSSTSSSSPSPSSTMTDDGDGEHARVTNQEDGGEKALMTLRDRVQRVIDRVRYSKYTLDLTVEFEYTLPDGKTYVGTSKRDVNFPSRLDLECPSCMKQAETIIDFFGHPGKEFLLFYEPKPHNVLTTRKEKHDNTKEGRYPLYCLDAGMVAPTSYERLAWGSALIGMGILNTIPKYRSRTWSERFITQRGLLPLFCIAAASGASMFGLSRLIEARLNKAEKEQQGSSLSASPDSNQSS